MEQWPVSLTGCVRIVLQAVTPASLAWDEDRTIIPNAAWARQFGGPELLGRSATSVTAGPWPALGNDLDRAMRQGVPAMVIPDDDAPSRFGSSRSSGRPEALRASG